MQTQACLKQRTMHRNTQDDPTQYLALRVYVRRSGYLLLVLGFAVIVWAVIFGSKSDSPIIPLAFASLPLVPMFIALRLADTLVLCSIAATITAILIFGASYLYFDAFLVHLSSLNSILLFEIPLVQQLIALPELALIVLQTRSRRRLGLKQ
jgi:hypothetical protein